MAATTKTKAAERFASLQKRDQAVRQDIEIRRPAALRKGFKIARVETRQGSRGGRSKKKGSRRKSRKAGPEEIPQPPSGG